MVMRCLCLWFRGTCRNSLLHSVAVSMWYECYSPFRISYESGDGGQLIDLARPAPHSSPTKNPEDQGPEQHTSATRTRYSLLTPRTRDRQNRPRVLVIKRALRAEEEYSGLSDPYILRVDGVADIVPELYH